MTTRTSDSADRRRASGGLFDAAAVAGAAPADVWVRAEAGADFALLRARLLGFVVPMTVLFLGWFFAYVALGAWAPGFMSRKVTGEVTMVLVLAVGQFASTFVITTAYTRYAGRRLDPLADRIKDRLEGGHR